MSWVNMGYGRPFPTAAPVADPGPAVPSEDLVWPRDGQAWETTADDPVVPRSARALLARLAELDKPARVTRSIIRYGRDHRIVDVVCVRSRALLWACWREGQFDCAVMRDSAGKPAAIGITDLMARLGR
jgi:hypothetical protein